MNKGISNIITLIILLLIAVSLAGGFMTWVSRQQNTIQENTQSQVETQTANTAKIIKIEHINPTNGGIVLRNTGSANVTINEVTIYVGGNLVYPGGGSWDDGTDFRPQGVKTYTWGSDCTGLAVRAVAPGIPDGDKTTCK